MKIAGIFLENLETLTLSVDPDTEEPLGIEYILSIAEKEGHNTKFFVPFYSYNGKIKTLTEEEFIKEIKDYNPDILALSLLTYQFNTGKKITSKLKKINPKLIAIAGGCHPSATKKVENPFDIYVIGEGEETFKELLRKIEKNQDYNDVKGISFKNSKGEIITPKRERIENLDLLPWPIRKSDYHDIPNRTLTYPSASKRRWTSVIYSRGCPYSCSFCSSPELWQRKVKYRSPKDVVKERNYLAEKYDLNFFFLEDLNLTVNRKKTEELCYEMLSNLKKGIYWGTCSNVNTSNKKILNLMSKAGCNLLYFGVESINPESLEKINKPQDLKQIKTTLETTQDFGIINQGTYMIGLPNETEESILEDAKQLPNYAIHQLRVCIATPIPGSQWYDDIDKDKLNPNLDLYDTQHLVYEHPSITPERMKELQHEIVRKFYHSKQWNKRMAQMIKDFPHLKQSINEFRDYVLANKFP